MKTKVQNLVSILAVSGGLVVAQPVLASQSPDFTKALVGTSVVDMPIKAAGLISKATSAEKQSVTIAVVKAAIGLTPSSAASIVAEISLENPAMAPIAAVTAANLQHGQLAAIAKAAVSSAPAQAGKIVAALVKEFPKDYSLIALAASSAAPSAGSEILTAVAEFIPTLQPAVQVAIANGNVSVAAVLNSSVPDIQSTPAGPSLSGPTFNTPFVPVPANPKIVTTAVLVPQPPGNYGQP